MELPQRPVYAFFALLGIAIILSGIIMLNGSSKAQDSDVPGMKLSLPFNDTIPARYTKYGEDVSPRVEFGEVPDNTESLALVVKDVDAPNPPFIHWVIWNIPVNATLEEGLPNKSVLSNGARQGINDFGETGYGGPKPPSGKHTYVFTVYALDRKVGLGPGSDREQLLKSISGHVLARETFEASFSH
ncbi:MAG: YbhB/YbcL family Raf kinase inhibitor-like protein [Candidatus Nanohaloarchaea archaeon]